uniref:FCH and mu domain containing endocytic adaptor 1 n=1 Tax=Molossus molossus TaxID=27622 RepID=A0A7J8I5Y9_MOLMO|nr:FCH and mu domain containing endocytic adaptor 1 [Molossus molossus]
MWPITAPVSVSHWTLFPQQLPRVELSAQVWTQLAQGADLLSIPDCVTLALDRSLQGSPQRPSGCHILGSIFGARKTMVLRFCTTI